MGVGVGVGMTVDDGDVMPLFPPPQAEATIASRTTERARFIDIAADLLVNSR
jgi:hypothetical protein